MTHKKLINMAMSMEMRWLMVELRDKYSFHNAVILGISAMPIISISPNGIKNERRDINTNNSMELNGKRHKKCGKNKRFVNM